MTMLEICGDNRFEIIAKAKAHLLDATNIDTSEDEMKVIDNFLFRCWQMGWLDKYAEQTEPQKIGYCNECKWFRDKQVCGRCRSKNMYAPKDEPNSSEFPNNCENEPYIDIETGILHWCGWKYRRIYEDEPQTEVDTARAIVHKIIDNSEIAEDAYPDLRQRLHDAVDEYEPQTERGKE